MALFVAAKFSQEEMPKIFDPGSFQDLKPQDFIVVPREGTEDIAFVAALEHKSVHQMKLRRDPYPRVIRRASEQEVESWWTRKTEERRALVIAKEKAIELKLDIKISHARIDPNDSRAVFHFTSDQRIDFRALVKDLSAILKTRIELWQIGVRDEARMVDGFGVCGQQTCCSSWLKDFRPITIRMAKDQDINLPPTKLSGQCGRLLCCLSYEVDQYRDLARKSLPKGSTVQWNDKRVIVIDRNLIAGTYFVAEEGGTTHTVKAEELGGDAQVPDQMKVFGKQAARDAKREANAEDAAEPEAPAEFLPPMEGHEPLENLRKKTRSKKRHATADGTELEPAEADGAGESDDAAEEGETPEEKRRRRSRGGRRRNRGGQRPSGSGEANAKASSSGNTPRPPQQETTPPPAEGGEKKQTGRPRKRGRRGGRGR